VAAFTSGAPVCRHRVRRIKGPLPGLRLSSLWERADGGGRGQGQGKETGDGDGEAASGGRTERERERERGSGRGRGEGNTESRHGPKWSGGIPACRASVSRSDASPLPSPPPPAPPHPPSRSYDSRLWMLGGAAFVVKSSPVRPISFLPARFPVYRVYPPSSPRLPPPPAAPRSRGRSSALVFAPVSGTPHPRIADLVPRRF